MKILASLKLLSPGQNPSSPYHFFRNWRNPVLGKNPPPKSKATPSIKETIAPFLNPFKPISPFFLEFSSLEKACNLICGIIIPDYQIMSRKNCLTKIFQINQFELV